MLSTARRIAISCSVLVTLLAAAAAAPAIAAPARGAGPGRPQRAASTSGLSAVSCTRKTFCVAVGSVTNAHGQTSPMAQTWNGHAWHLIAAPPVPGGPGDVSCASRSFCMAVSAGGATAATWNGSKWTVADPPATPHFAFTHVSCASSAFCMTVGDFFGPSAVWNGSTWTELPVPMPAGSTTFNLAGVSCTRPSYCVAAGVYATDPHGELLQTEAEAWNGKRWARISSPEHNQESTFNAITCMLRQGCVAVGNYGSEPDVGYNIAARYTGGHWHVTRIPGGYGYGAGWDNGVSGPTDVSCASAVSCMTVGSYLAGPEHSLAIVWNGKTWRLTRLSWPAGGVADVSCTSPVNCVAVGQSHSQAAAKRWNGTAWSAMAAATAG
jgi:hypothetical protein